MDCINYQAIFFDFDGVILDSVHVKTQAFSFMFRQYGPEIEKEVVEYHLSNGGMSRFKKFEYYYTQLLNKPLDHKIAVTLGNDFSRLSLQGVLESPFIPGALETLQELKQKKILCFIVSGTPDSELKLIVDKRGLAKYFSEIHGSPRKKDVIIKDIALRYKLVLQECLFVGDAMTDYEAAKSTGTKFLGIVKSGEVSPFQEGTIVFESVKIF